ncbi:MAG: carbonic anhydrase [Xanthomonadaceae bacterium]|nr:carbonic anhydrase [Xanthomonadaceae bacterium]
MKTSKITESFDKLKAGNARFTSGVMSVESLLSQKKMAELAEKGQKPFAIVLTCSDSRSPVEMIFDQGLGDLFVVRVAGNVVAPSLLASIEFAAANFGSSIIVVMGHSKCGAVNATLQSVKNPDKTLPSASLEELVGRIRPAVIKSINNNNKVSDAEQVELAAAENVKRSMSLIVEQSSIVRGLIEKNEISVVGAILDITTGKVNFLS